MTMEGRGTPRSFRHASTLRIPIIVWSTQALSPACIHCELFVHCQTVNGLYSDRWYMADIENIKPISYFKANAAEMLQTLRETGAPYVITQNGEAAAVLVDAREYAKMERALELLRLLQMAEADVAAGRVVSVEEARAAVKYDRKKRDLKST